MGVLGLPFLTGMQETSGAVLFIFGMLMIKSQKLRVLLGIFIMVMFIIMMRKSFVITCVMVSLILLRGQINGEQHHGKDFKNMWV